MYQEGTRDNIFTVLISYIYFIANLAVVKKVQIWNRNIYVLLKYIHVDSFQFDGYFHFKLNNKTASSSNLTNRNSDNHKLLLFV